MDPRLFYIEYGKERSEPVDLPMLESMAAKGEIPPNLILVEVSTGRRVTAKSLLDFYADGPSSAPRMGGLPFRKAVLWRRILRGICATIGLLCAGVLTRDVIHVFHSANVAAARASEVRNLKDVALATLLYAGDSNDRLPPLMASAHMAQPLVERYLPEGSSIKVFTPVNPTGGKFLGDRRLNAASLIELEWPAETLMFYGSKGWFNGPPYSLAFSDGHVRIQGNKTPSDYLSVDIFAHPRLERSEAVHTSRYRPGD